MRTRTNRGRCSNCGAALVYLREPPDRVYGQTDAERACNADTVHPGDRRYDPTQGHVAHLETCPAFIGRKG